MNPISFFKKSNIQSISKIQEKMASIIGHEYLLPVTKNKGLPGLFLEELLNIPHTSNCLDCSDGELKLISLKKLKNGLYSPRETIAITMLSPDELRTKDFNSSRCFKKMNNMLIVSYYRTGDMITFMTSTIICKENPVYSELYKIVELDYNEIQKNYIEHGILKSKIGVLLQNRTKGPGHGSTSRAFYLRTKFISRYIPLNL